MKPIPIVTTYEPELPDNASVTSGKRRSKTPSIAGERLPLAAGQVRAPSRAGSVKAASVKSKALGRPMSPRPDNTDGEADGEMTSAAEEPARPRSRMSTRDSAASPRFSEPADDGGAQRRATSPNRASSPNGRATSPFGHRPHPNLMTVTEEDGGAEGRGSRYQSEGQSGRDSRAGMLGRSGTVVSRAGTLGRNGTMSRTQNGGVVGGRRGAFGRGAGTSVGTQPEEVLGRDDIHVRAELSERILDDSTLRRLTNMEKGDANRLAKIIKSEGKTEAQAVKGSIKELERLVRLQKEAAGNERKSQVRLSKWTAKEHKARLRFLKEKERYEKIEGELRNAENDYEERRDHGAGLTAQVAEVRCSSLEFNISADPQKTQDLDDLRSQKAADDVSFLIILLDSFS